MKFSYQWLCELVPGLNAEPSELQRLITMKTAECEGIEPFGTQFARVAAARIVSVEPLPKGKNKLVEIDAGSAGLKSVEVVTDGKVDYSKAFTAMNTITAGTGKYAGISGRFSSISNSSEFKAPEGRYFLNPASLFKIA